MTDATQRPMMVQHADADGDGDPMYEYTVRFGGGASKTIELNLRRLFSPGDRRTGSHDLLQAEAKLAADGVELGNPAKPVNGDVAQKHAEWCDRNDLQPAWDVCERREWSI